MLDVIAIFLGQVNTNNLYNLVSKHSLAAQRGAQPDILLQVYFIQGRASLSTTPGHGNWATPSWESIQSC